MYIIPISQNCIDLTLENGVILRLTDDAELGLTLLSGARTSLVVSPSISTSRITITVKDNK